MTAGRTPDRDGADIEALVADRYLDALLAAGDRHADDAPADATLDPDLRAAATVLRRSLVRVHPSFRFEERLAGRLRELAAAGGVPVAAPVAAPGAAPVAGRVISLAWPGRAGGSAGASAAASVAAASALTLDDPALEAILAGTLDPAAEDPLDLEARLAAARRPLIVGGAITSAAISIVGVAWVAWRATRAADRSGSAVGLGGPA